MVYEHPGMADRLDRLRQEVEAFGSLREHVGWQRLLKRTIAQKEEWFEKLARKIASGQPLDEKFQRQVDYDRGWYDGAIYVLRHPELSEEALESALAVAWALRSGEPGISEIPDSQHT